MLFNEHSECEHTASPMRKKRGRPRLVDFACPNCRADALVCNATCKQGNCRVRYYRCKICGHRGVLVSGARKDWWKDSKRLSSLR